MYTILLILYLKENMKAIYKFHAEVGRMGDLEGIFVASQANLASLIDSEHEVYFGECLGKHSEITFPVINEYFTLVTDNSDFIKMFEDFGMESGINPLSIYEESLSEGCYK